MSDWTNPFGALDVSHDGDISPIDALIGINELNDRTFSSSQNMLPDRSGLDDLPFYDVNGDGFLSPLDVLIVINAINDGFVAPTIDIALFQDTAADGTTNDDLVTANPNIVGDLRDSQSNVTRLTAQVDGGEREDVIVEAGGSFSFDSPLALDGSEDGEHTLRFTAFENNVILVAEEFTFALDTSAPVHPAQVKLEQSSDTGLFASDGITNDSTLTFSGDAVAETIISLLANDQVVGRTTANSPWEITTEILPDGEYALTVIAEDIAGNQSSASEALTVVIDTAASAAPTGLALSTESDSGASDSDGITNNDTPTVVGDAESGSRVVLYIGENVAGYGAANSPWSITTAELSDGDQAFTATAKDLAGNVSEASTVYTVTIDTVAPTLELTSAALITDLAYTIIYRVIDGNDGERTVTELVTLGEGGNVLSRAAMDAAGNRSSASWTITLDTVKPTVQVEREVATQVPDAPSIARVQPGDYRLFVQQRNPDGTLSPEEAFVAKGLNWSPQSRTTTELTLFDEFALWYESDIPLIADMGVNVVRVYQNFGLTEQGLGIMDKLYEHGLKVIMTVDSGDPRFLADIDYMEQVVNHYKDHPALLMWSINNEWDLHHFYGAFSSLEASADFVEQVAQMIKTVDPLHPVMTVMVDLHNDQLHRLSPDAFPLPIGPSEPPYTVDIVNNMVPSVDIWGFNVYRGNSLQDVFDQWESISNKPMILAEFGVDSYDKRIGTQNEPYHAETNRRIWDEIYFELSAERERGSAVGALIFDFTDEWWQDREIGVQNPNNGDNFGKVDGFDREYFGITDIDRNPKQIFFDWKDRFARGQDAVELSSAPTIRITSQIDLGYPNRGAQFELDGKLVFARAGGGFGARGMNVGVLDPNTGILMGIDNFDTYQQFGSPKTNMQEMIDYLDSLPDGSIISLAIADEGGFIDFNSQVPWNDSRVEAAYQKLEELGSTDIRNVAYSGGWAMITVKGRGKLAEGTAAPGQPVAISTQVALNDLDPDFDRRPLDPPPPVDPVRLSGEQVTFDLSGFDATSGIAGFHWRLKNPNASVTDWVNQIAPVVTLRIEIQTEGIYELEVQSEDAAGHLSESSRTAFVIDRTAPTAVLESAAVVTDPNYELIYTIDDAIDGSRQLSEQLVLALGVNLFTRVVTDAAGNNRVAIFSISLE